MDYRYELRADGDDLIADVSCPSWEGFKIIEPVRLKCAAPLRNSCDGRNDIHSRLLERTRSALSADGLSWRPFTDRLVTVWRCGNAPTRIVTDLREIPTGTVNYEHD